jgi:uncharacterized membrane protein
LSPRIFANVSVVTLLIEHLERARQAVPQWSRWLVVIVTVGLALATFGHLPLLAMGLDLSVWEAFVHDTCGPFCHQDPGRSFHLSAHVFPLCARCSGMWLGITLGVALAMLYRPAHRWWSGAVLAVAATAASAFDFLREESGGTPSEWVRAVLGFLLFLGVTLAVSFDTLAVLSAIVQWIRRLHRGNGRAHR